MKKVIIEITSNRLGAAAVVENGKVIGIVTDGDLRRMMMQTNSMDRTTAKDVMSKDPKKAEKDMMAVDALNLMKQYNISQLIITDKEKYVGMVHLHDLVKEGII